LALVDPTGNGTSPGAAQVLTNVAKGGVNSTSTDAINGSQLYGLAGSTASALGGGSTVNPDGSISAPTYNIQGGTYDNVGGALGALDTGMTDITNNLNNGTFGPVQRVPGATDQLTLVGAGGTAANPGNPQLLTNVAPGSVTATSTDAINGSQLYATNQKVTQLDNTAVKYDVDSTGKKMNSVTLQGGDPNAPVVLHNVAAGTVDTDAVNVGQLNQATVNVGNQVLQQANSYATQVGTQAVQQANTYTEQRVSALSNSIDKVRTEAHQAAAVGLATASLRYDERPGKVSMAVGGGTWLGSTAASMGVGYTSPTGRVRLNLAGTTDGTNWGIGAGFGFTFNSD